MPISSIIAQSLSLLDLDILDVEGVDVSGQVAEEGQADVDEEVGAAAADEEDAERWDLLAC
jgi:hypothetical protein